MADLLADVKAESRWLLRLLLGSQRWAWALPLVVVFVVRRSPASRIGVGIGLIIAVWLVLLVQRAPGRALLILVALLPFQILVLSLLYRLGLPAGVVRAMSAWKETLGIGIALAGARAIVTERHRLDALDKIAIAYVALVTAYLLFPGIAAGAALNLGVRLLAYRADIGFVLLFLGVRHAPLPAGLRRKFAQTVVVVGFIVAAVAVFEYFFSSTWNTFVVHVIQFPRYHADVLHAPDPNPLDIRVHGVVAGRDIIRVGSVLLGALALGFYLLVALGLSIERLNRERSGLLSHLATPVLAAALLFTFTRSAILSGLVIAALALRPVPGRMRAHRVRLALILAVLLVLALPVAGGIGLTARTSGAFRGTEQSAPSHVQSFHNGLNSLVRDPVGLGLGSAAGIGDRFSAPTQLISENAYIQVGNELGVLTLLLFVALLVALIRRLRVSADEDPDEPLARAFWIIGIGLAVGGLFLHIWLDFTLTWTFWGGAGLAIGAVERRRREAKAGPLRSPVAPVAPVVRSG